MLLTIAAILFILWLLGFTLNLAGGAIHLLLIIIFVLVIIELLGRRRV